MPHPVHQRRPAPVRARGSVLARARRQALVRDIRLASQTEGCVVDGRTDLLYVGEEKRGVWRMSTAPDSDEARRCSRAWMACSWSPMSKGWRSISTRRHPAASCSLPAKPTNAADAGHPSESACVSPTYLTSGRLVARFRVVQRAISTESAIPTASTLALAISGLRSATMFSSSRTATTRRLNQNFKLVPGTALIELLEQGNRPIPRPRRCKRTDGHRSSSSTFGPHRPRCSRAESSRLGVYANAPAALSELEQEPAMRPNRSLSERNAKVRTPSHRRSLR